MTSDQAGQRRAYYDRDEVLGRTDLASLADELLGGHAGRGRSAKWPSPVPGHPQTGKSPPMSVFTTRRGDQRWTCFATGESGTAIDLVMMRSNCSFGDAIVWLAQRAGVGSIDPSTPVRPQRPAVERSKPPERQRVRGRVEAYVATCERRLWLPEGLEARRWLIEERGFGEGVLRANRVGYDPGPSGFARPGGLPKLGEAVVLPTLNDRDRAIFYQARYLEPDLTGRKYDNPGSWMAPNPHLADVRTPAPWPDRSDRLIVTEGIPDALAAATAGYATRAVLGVHNAHLETALRLVDEPRMLVVAFDGDEAGREAVNRLVGLLAEQGRRGGVTCWTPPSDRTDLNDWLARRCSPEHRRLGRTRTSSDSRSLAP